MAISSVTETILGPEFATPFEDRASAVENLLKFIETEYKKGNLTVTKEKYKALLQIQIQQRRKLADPLPKSSAILETPPLPKPLYPPLFNKFQVPKATPPTPIRKARRLRKKYTFKQIEAVVIAILENLANILDNLHLFSKFPMFPKPLLKLLKHTNRLWVLILVFLIRKTVSQLLNVIRKEKKVRIELNILKSNGNSKLLEQEELADDSNILRKYEKVIRDLKFDKLMLKIELIGNFLDLAFNFIELHRLPVPQWFMNTLNFASMGMTIYRMNKDDEYIDDDITEELI